MTRRNLLSSELLFFPLWERSKRSFGVQVGGAAEFVCFGMGSFGMDWNQKSTVLWDWENLPPVGANANANGNLKNVLQAETKLTGAVSTMGHESVQSSGGTFSSSLEMGYGSSKSSLSASIDSSSKVGNNKEFKFATVKEPDKNISKDSGFGKVDDTGNSPPLGVAVSRGEPVIGLKLGKRTYFEDVCGGQSVKNSPSGASAVATSTASAKKAKVAQQNTHNSYCQVEGCKLDLLSAKDYHRKHRVCEAHSKTPKVIVAGLERRFCQQCSRFHALSEFDQNKRSCRRRLNDHNARRRKPQPEAFSSSRLSTMFYDARQQTSLLFGQGSYGQMRSCASSSWDNPGGFKFTETKASWLKPTRPLGVGEMHLSSQQVSNNILPHGEHHDFDGLMTFKGTNVKALNQGAEASAAVATNSNGAPDLQRALSLLSSSSVAAANLQPSAQLHPGDTTMAGTSNPVMDLSPGLWQGSPPLDQQAQFQVFHRLGATGHELRLPKPPSYDSSTHYGQMHH